jgi:hypothetical protein
MKRFVVIPALALACAGLLSALTASSVSARQTATKAAPTVSAPAAPARFYRPVKGTATIDVLQGAPKRVGPEMVTMLKIKNTSAGRIDLLQIDEYWYDRKPEQVTGSTVKWRQPFNPGDVIEVSMKSPHKGRTDLYRSQYSFSHSNGKITATAVKKIG